MKTKHRNAARQKWQAKNYTMGNTIASMSNAVFTEQEKAEMCLPVRLALEKLRLGDATTSEFHTLASACNITIICAEKIDESTEMVCLKARDALNRINERHEKTGLFRLDGMALTELADMIDIFQQLIEVMTSSQLISAIQDASQRMEKNGVNQ